MIDVLMAALLWQPFVWMSTPDNPHGAIEVQVADSHLGKGWMQLDTGLHRTVVYAAGLPGSHPSVAPGHEECESGERVHIELLVAAQQLRPTDACVNDLGPPEAIQGLPSLGSIGIDVLGDSVLVIDSRDAQLALTHDAQALAEVHPTQWISMPRLADTRPYVNAAIGSKHFVALLDTGSAPLGLEIPQSVVHDLRLVTSAPVRKISGNAWGKPVEIDCIKSRDAVRLDEIALVGAEVCSLVTGPQYLGRSTTAGMQLFENRVLIIDFANRRYALGTRP